MLFIIGTILFSLGIILSSISGIIALKLKHYIHQNYKQSDLLKYMDSTKLFRIKRLREIYQEISIRDIIIDKFVKQYSIISRTGIILFFTSLILIVFHYIILAVKR